MNRNGLFFINMQSVLHECIHRIFNVGIYAIYVNFRSLTERLSDMRCMSISLIFCYLIIKIRLLLWLKCYRNISSSNYLLYIIAYCCWSKYICNQIEMQRNAISYFCIRKSWNSIFYYLCYNAIIYLFIIQEWKKFINQLMTHQPCMKY